MAIPTSTEFAAGQQAVVERLEAWSRRMETDTGDHRYIEFLAAWILEAVERDGVIPRVDDVDGDGGAR